MKLPPDALGLLSKGLKPEIRARWPLASWIIDLGVVASEVWLLCWLYRAITN